MTQALIMFNESVSRLLKNFTLQDSLNLEQIKALLLQYTPQSEDDIARLNTFLQREVKSVLTSIMVNGNLNKVAKLIELLCDVSRQQKEVKNNQKRPSIKQSLAIIIVQDVLECLGINDMKEILPIISEKICSFKQLDVTDQNRMLRVINHLLKRISKTQDYLIRGQLQFTLTKILPICHDSGFHYRVPISKGIEIVQDDQNQEYKNVFSSEGITYQFYKQFWELQKYFMDPNELTHEDLNKSNTEQPQRKANANYRSDPLLSLRLKNIEKVLNQIVLYMNKNPSTKNPTPLLKQPIKFLTNTHLLEFQLSDEYFRKIILIQALIFTFTLKHLKPTGNTLKGVMLSEPERQTINKIEQTAERYLDFLEQNTNSLRARKNEGERLSPSALEMMKYFFTSELEWLELKDHWKQKKKTFLRIDLSTPQTQQNDKKQKQAVDYSKKIAQVQKKIADQMNIEGDTLLRFLTEPCIPHIVTAPTQTSFAYFWPQGKRCLDNFDYQKSQQSQFQTKSEYNMFEWKSLRSLYKETLRQICLGQKNPKLREYKALAFIQKKQKEFRQRQNKAEFQDSTPADKQSETPQNIQKAIEGQEIRQEKQQNKALKTPGRLQQEEQEDESPRKMNKID